MLCGQNPSLFSLTSLSSVEVSLRAAATWLDRSQGNTACSLALSSRAGASLWLISWLMLLELCVTSLVDVGVGAGCSSSDSRFASCSFVYLCSDVNVRRRWTVSSWCRIEQECEPRCSRGCRDRAPPWSAVYSSTRSRILDSLLAEAVRVRPWWWCKKFRKVQIVVSLIEQLVRQSNSWTSFITSLSSSSVIWPSAFLSTLQQVYNQASSDMNRILLKVVSECTLLLAQDY